ncbi:protein of unknown function [Pararobbsia alpina]
MGDIIPIASRRDQDPVLSKSLAAKRMGTVGDADARTRMQLHTAADAQTAMGQKFAR